MTRFSKLRPFFLPFVGLLMLGASLLLHLVLVEEDEDALRKDLESEIQADFLALIEKTQTEAVEILGHYHRGHGMEQNEEALRLIFSKDCQLVQWSESERMPSVRILGDLCNFPDKRTITDKNKVFYLRHLDTEDYNLVTLIPVQVDYKVDNAFLPPYLYLGRYGDDHSVKRQMGDFIIHYKQVDGALKIFDEAGNFVYCLEIPDPSVFRYAIKDRLLLIGFLGLLCILFGFYNLVLQLKFKVAGKPISGVFLFVMGLFLVRYLLFVLNLPNAYRPMEFFSSSVLAIDSLSPTLGDLFLNVLVLVISIYILLKHYRRWISRFFRWALKKETFAWTVQCITLTVCVMFTWWFFEFSKNLVHHSTIYFEFSNIFELDIYSFVGFFIIASVLIGLEMILLELLRFSFHFFSGNGTLYKILLSLAFLGGLSFVFFGFKIPYFISVTVVFGLSLLVFVRTRRRLTFQLDLFNFLLLISIFSLLTTIGMIQGGDVRTEIEMERLADRQSDQHDLITESLFRRVTRDVEAESFLLDYREREGLSFFLKENFFDSNFKGYEVRVYVYDNQWNLLDRTSEAQAFQPIDSSFTLDELGRRTMTPGLFIVPYIGGLYGSLYVGQFDVLLRSLGNIKVLVELEPTQFQANRLYPQLLLDDQVRSKAILPPGFSYAVYQDRKLSRKNSNAPFTFFFSGPAAIDSLEYVHEKTPDYENLYFKVSQRKIVQVRHDRRTLFDSVNFFSFVFYFFVLGGILLMLPAWIWRMLRNPRQALHLTLKGKIQVFFLSIAILPVFVVVFFLSPYIRAHIYEDFRTEVQEQTQSVLNQLRDDYLEMWGSSTNSQALEAALQNRIEEMEKSLLHDINIYHHTGVLDLTTQPSIYELGLTSRFMNPLVYQRLDRGDVSDIVMEEKIGYITYFSSFYPILTAESRIVGFLNIPYFKNQDQVNEQSLSLLTLLVNIYVFVFLAIGLLAVLISNSITRPLGLLNKQLRLTTLGGRNEPIAWVARDEIGDIIDAYNQMLQQLAESEEKLARNQREMAWKEMAQQIAHEIKNPLTPMRLSVQHLQQVWSIKRPDNEKLNKLFQKVTGTVLVQIEQLVNIANSFSQFAKMPEPQRTTFLLADVVAEVFDLYSHDAKVQLKIHLPEEEFYVHSDRDQLSRVFNNLIKNGIQAIEHETGLINVRLTVEGESGKVSIQDNGKGIPDEIGLRVFEPKFSTKNSGMGLGLAMVKKIVEGSEGHIYFETEVGKGTTFHVELPRAEEA